MHRIALFALFTLGLFLPLLGSAPAHAQATRTWVSGVGDDANPCSRTAPCKTFAGAISKTAAGGEINCLDPGGFGALTITKAITISCEIGTAGVLVAGTNGITVSAAATDVVVLNGLDFEGLGSGLAGISVVQAAAVHVQHCRIAGFRSGAASGILFAPPAGTTGELFVSDTIISENGVGTTSGGIIVRPAGTGVAQATITRVLVDNNSVGIQTDGTGSTGGIHVTVTDSTVSGNTNAGIHAISVSGGANSSNFANRVVSAANGTGYLADGPGALVFLNNSVATANSTGVNAVNGGLTFSYKNNAINNNLVSDGSATNQITPE
jgi:hypothetical protein